MPRRKRERLLNHFQLAICGSALSFLVVTSGCSCQDTSEQFAESQSRETASQRESHDSATNGAEQSSLAAQSGAENPSNGQAGMQPDSSEQARQAAEDLAAQAAKKAEQGDFGGAFEAVVQALESIKGFPNDAGLRELEKSLLSQAERYGERANQGANTDPAKPIIVDRAP